MKIILIDDSSEEAVDNLRLAILKNGNGLVVVSCLFGAGFHKGDRENH